MKFYEKQKKTNFNVGLFVIVSLVILIFGYLWLINYLEQGNMTKVTVAFPEVGSLELGDGVLIMGVNRGRVTNIQLDTDRVLVDLAIKLDQPLKRDSRFIVKNTSVMGSMRVILIPGKGKELLDIEKIQAGESATGISEMFSEAGDVLFELKSFLQKLNSPDNVISKFSGLADSIQFSLKKVNNIIDNNEDSITSVITSLESITNQTSELVAANKAAIESTINSADTLSADLIETNRKLLSLMVELQEIAVKINTDESTIGQLTTNDELYQSLNSTIASMDSLISDMKKNPKKYFKVEVF